MSKAAPRLSNELFQHDWNSSPANQSVQEAKISYLMVEKVTPPDYMWEKIVRRLDMQDAAAQQLQTAVASSPTKAIALMVAMAAASISLILYWLI